MKYCALLVALASLLATDAFSPEANKAVKPVAELKKAAASTFAAIAIGSSILGSPVVASAIDMQQPVFSSSNIVAEKVVRQGLYSDYEVEINQETDDARSTFKSASETKSKKGKYTAILAILVVGSFIVPMAQYFWYVRDDDSSDKFFAAKDIPDPEPPKKKGWFN
ncbi:hypothetical protein IV203_001825 [Nitzschia inconspicua]|uniref:Uncharacterized protein n=1 Tax=Nitzschia inconspicua TaxID=303405 RepID=A0A9K3L7W1_9STRA|nr:hypothetical protein IV203_001825 [Nitzschia inconspicua]